ncbi:alpha/beta hydrolase [Granulosicoccus sp. 3-233]|uniref:alpha/beta hydrolase n=1 Tax=Granulosicoccus sp. 3-233 TaxID=3417969 RepID=UPI003D326BE0
MTRYKLLPLAFCGVLLTACSSDDPVAESDGVLTWRSCPEDDSLDCATLRVPMNYGDDRAGMIDIALNRLPAIQQPSTGALLFNPGGPGASGLEVLQILQEVDSVPDAIRQHHDLIGFDPRGVGESTPIDCDTSDVDLLGDYLVDATAIEAFVEQSAELAARCLEQEGDYLLQLGSMNVVRDMDSIRQSLDLPRLDFIGYSYGSRLAALYLQTYPDTSGAVILDGSLRPDSSVGALAEGALSAMQRNLEALLQDCTISEPDCDPARLQDLLIEKVDVLLRENREAELALLGELVVEASQNPALGELLTAPLVSYLMRGDRSGLELLVQLLELDIDDGAEDDTLIHKAILCADDATRPTAEQLSASLPTFNALSDLFAEAYIGQAGSCAGWPESIDPLSPIATGTAPVALVIGGTSDAQTPLVWSEEMARAIGGHYLASSHQGHTSVFNGQNDCVDSIVTTFLLDGLLPGAADCL